MVTKRLCVFSPPWPENDTIYMVENPWLGLQYLIIFHLKTLTLRLVHFDGETLWQGENDETNVTLLRNIRDIEVASVHILHIIYILSYLLYLFIYLFDHNNVVSNNRQNG